MDENEDNLDVRTERNDDFPAPDGPIIVRNYPLWTCPERLLSIIFSDFESVIERFFH